MNKATMGLSNDQEQNELALAGGKLALKDISLVADDLVLDVAPQLSQPNGEAKPNSYTVELFWDEAMVTATELLYGKATYPLKNIDSLQILKLHRKRSVIQKKLSNFLAAVIMTVGLVLLFSPLPWPVRILDLIMVTGSISYVVYFNWWIEQRRRGEFGLVMTMKIDSKVVITSHSLKAIQTLYQIMFRRLDMANLSAESLMINMYTGETIAAE
ncbi:MAG: DUF6232 family protein [Cyanobacteria bacterium P01_D01_bin.2]